MSAHPNSSETSQLPLTSDSISCMFWWRTAMLLLEYVIRTFMSKKTVAFGR